MLRARVCCCAHTVRPAVTLSQNRYEEGEGGREGGRRMEGGGGGEGARIGEGEK